MSTTTARIIKLVPYGQPEDRLFIALDIATTTLTELQGAGAPTNGPTGTGAGAAIPGSRYTDTTNADLYVNIGTKASPTWAAVRIEEGV